MSVSLGSPNRKRQPVMIKFKAMLATLLAFCFITTFAAPGNAYFTSLATVSYYELNIKDAVQFDRQADGTGVKVQWTGYQASASGASNALTCSVYFESGTKWSTIYMRVFDGNSGALVASKSISSASVCDTNWTVNLSGYDEGWVRFVVMANAHLKNFDDIWVEYDWYLWPSGGNVLNSADWVYS